MKDWQQLEKLVACPFTREPLRRLCENAVGTASGRSFALMKGVPVLRHGPAVEVKDPNHVSNAVGDEFRQMMLACDGPVLFLGAGASDFRAEHVVEAEYNLFRDTDVVADAHCLPFKDNVFRLAVALNVFEHLREPHIASAELLRVLAPGGRVLIHTAFLQVLHEEPHHYYGATEFGIRQWFQGFDGVQVAVSPNFNPYYGMSWMANDLLWHVEARLGAEARATLGRMTMEELAEFWRTRNHGCAGVWEVLNQLPQEVLSRFAAGFELRATKA